MSAADSFSTGAPSASPRAMPCNMARTRDWRDWVMLFSSFNLFTELEAQRLPPHRRGGRRKPRAPRLPQSSLLEHARRIFGHARPTGSVILADELVPLVQARFPGHEPGHPRAIDLLGG